MPDDYDTIYAVYQDNRDYDSAGSLSKAWAFVAACRGLIPLMSDSGKGMVRVRHLGVEQIERAEQRALTWIGQQNESGGGGYKHASFEDFRC